MNLFISLSWLYLDYEINRMTSLVYEKNSTIATLVAMRDICRPLRVL